MTIQDLLRMPKGMTPDEWDNELKRRDNINKKIKKLLTDKQDTEDALDVLKDEIGSERYKKKEIHLKEIELKIERLRKELNTGGLK